MQVDYKDFPVGKCPMTKKNVLKYGIRNNFIKEFCRYGCSPICAETLIQHIERKIEDEI